jgi:hypothetical protein
MGIHHLSRALDYAPFVAAEGRAQVHLTSEDWHVVADTLFKLNTPRELLPEAIESYELTNEQTTIQLKTAGCVIDLEMM